MSQVVRRSAAILRALEHHPEGRSVAEIADVVDLPRSSVHRLLKALEQEHLVTGSSADRGFRLGPALMHLASSTNSWLVNAVRPYLEDLSRSLRETVDLAVLSGSEVYFVDQVPGDHRLQAVSRTGLAFPAHTTANGKALLAEMNDDRVATLLAETLTAHGALDLLKELRDVRTSGIAFDREDHHPGISAVGTALANPFGIAVALSVPVPTGRFVDQESEIAEQLLKSRDQIELHLQRVASP